MWGVRGRALSHPRRLVLSGVRPGPTTHWLWLRGVRAWGPVTNPTACALASWLCAFWGQHEGARGGRLVPGCGKSWVGLSPSPVHSSFRACGRGPLPTGCGCGGAGVGTCHQPHRARSCELALRAVGARPGKAPLAWVCSVRGRALSHLRPLVLSAVWPGPASHWPWVRGMRAWESVTYPTARPLASWLCAQWGRHEGARGGRLLPWCGPSGVGRSPTPNRPRPGRPPPCAPHHQPPPTPEMAREPHSCRSPGTRKIGQKRHAVQVAAVHQRHPGGHGVPYHPSGAHPRGGPQQ